MKACNYVAFDVSLKSSVFDSAGCGTLSLTKHGYIIYIELHPTVFSRQNR